MTTAPVPEAPGSGLTPPPARWVVVAPTYNHAAALGKVLDELSERQLPVIAVNDGSTDHTDRILRGWLETKDSSSMRVVLRHPFNHGKAAALRSGFKEAARLGFTHAATIDTDGQHDVTDLMQLMELSSASLKSVIVGARMRVGSEAPLPSRVGRALSNWLVWIESGVSVFDSQSGMRIYPLEHMSVIGGNASRYGFETEVLVRAGWHGVPVKETPIRCVYRVPGGRTTHFRLWGDTFAAFGMHVRLLCRAHFPGASTMYRGSDRRTGTIPRRLVHWLSPWRLAQMASGDGASRERLCASIGVGLLMATLPIYGLKTLTCLWLAARLRLHPLAVLGVSSLSTPPLGLVFAALSICVGGLVIHGALPDLTALSEGQSVTWSTLHEFIAEWLVGSVIAGSVLGGAGYVLMRSLLAIPLRRSDGLEAS